jgi:leader peptidase (prepilin peptidase)/N-methyltransferase
MLSTAQRWALLTAFGLAATLSWLTLDPLDALASTFLATVMLAIALIDAEQFIIPDVLSLPAIPVGLACAWATDVAPPANLVEHLLAMIVGGLALYLIREAYFRCRAREGLGLGDVKLGLAAGAWTGLSGLGHVLLLASVFALCWVVVVNARNLAALKGATPIAFGVFLAPAIWVVWFAGKQGLTGAG